MSLPYAVLVDLDSTLCDTTHRRHLAPPKDEGDRTAAWAAYSAACDDDDPILGVHALLGMFADDIRVVFLTGRNESARAATERWLHRWGVRYDRLVMRPDDEDRLHGWKAEALDELTEQYRFLLAIDDMPQGIEMAADAGILGLLVANAWREETKALVRGERTPAPSRRKTAWDPA